MDLNIIIYLAGFFLLPIITFILHFIFPKMLGIDNATTAMFTLLITSVFWPLSIWVIIFLILKYILW